MKIPLSNPDITAKERKAVMEVLRTPDLSLGPKLAEFEQAGADYVGTKYAVAVNSGTSGLHLVIRSLGIGPGDEVITTPFSFIASANCILFEKARPVFADIDRDTMNISPQAIIDIIRKRHTKKTRAILAVDVFGHPAEWEALYDIAAQYNIKLIEDSCEALGADYRSPHSNHRTRWEKHKKAGSFGQAGVFAFYPNKQITTGEGGLIVTNSKNIFSLCRSMRNQGRSDGSRWLNHVRLGYNYRLSDINCVLGIAQLQRLENILNKRKRAAKQYYNKLKDIGGICLPASRPHVNVSWFVYVIRLQAQFNRRDRNAIMQGLQKRGVACSNYFSPIHLQPFYRKMFGYKRGAFPVTEHVADRTIALPFYSNLKRDEIVYVAETLKDVIRKG